MLFKPRQKSGWLSVAINRDRVDIAHVARTPGARPVVTLCESYRREGSLEETMGRLRKDRGLDRFRLTAMMPAGQYQVLQLDAPPVPASELAAALRWRLKDLIDYPVESAVVDTLVIPADERPGARGGQVLAVVARAEAIRQHAEALTRSGLALAAIDIQEVAQRNVSALFEAPGRGVAVLAFDDTGGLLTVTAGGELYLARRLDSSLADLEGDSEDAVQAVYDRIVLEVQRSIDHFDRQFGLVSVSRLLLAGIGAADGLRDALAENLDLPVAPLDLAQVLDFPAIPELRSASRQAQVLSGIGAALRDDPVAGAR